MPPLSVVIACKNERANIRDCILAARAVADEIVVADNGSTDGTLDIVAELGDCRVVRREWIGFASFKNWAIAQARHEWVLVVDADERVTPALAEEISALLATPPEHDAYRVPFDTYFLGHPLRYGGWSSHRVVRLVRRQVCRYQEARVHESIEVDTGRIGDLQGRMTHHTARDLESFLVKHVRYGLLAGEDLYERGARPDFFYTLLHAPSRFVLHYVLRGGMFDGFPGLVACLILAMYAFVKDAQLWALHYAPPNAAAPSDSSAASATPMSAPPSTGRAA